MYVQFETHSTTKEIASGERAESANLEPPRTKQRRFSPNVAVQRANLKRLEGGPLLRIAHTEGGLVSGTPAAGATLEAPVHVVTTP